MLLRTANAGRLPTKFFVDAGGRVAGAGSPVLGLPHALRRAHEGVGQPREPVAAGHELRDDPADRAAGCPANGTAATTSDPVLPVAATNAQVAELMDDMLVFQSDTRNIDVRAPVGARHRRDRGARDRARAVLPLASAVAAGGRALLSSPSFAARKDVSMNQLDFSGRTAVITGGAMGIGLAVARRLAASGARVALWDRDAAALDDGARGARRRHAGRSRSTSPTRPPSQRVAQATAAALRRHRRPRLLGGHHRAPTCRSPTIRSTTGSACSTSTCTASSCATAPSCR